MHNLIDDPEEQINLSDKYPEQTRRLARAFGSLFKHGASQTEVKGIQGKYELASGGID